MASDGQSKLIQTPTTANQLGAIIKSARDIMRKDKGLSGELDRLPMLTWIMFLKFLDDTEQIREEEALLSGDTYRSVVEAPYRWRDWAAKEDGITGDELISFVNNEEAVRPDGTRGPGLFAYLRSLQSANGGDRRDVVATVFRGAVNRMINGYLLRDVINKVNAIDFGSTKEVHTLGHLYESMLKEMRDAAGDSGEFYTPRPVVRFMVEVVDPRLGETVLDPACGTGGFLSESFSHMNEQCETVQDREILQRESIYGGEAKPLPYLMAQMNLLLHGLESPNIDPLNSLRFPMGEIGEKDRADVILTNPPFGGEEERGIQNNFPADRQTSETALLFLQLIMRKLRRHPKPGRAGVIVPNGTLFAGGVAARIKEELLNEFNLHTLIRLPKGVFEPYADIPTNILFFDRSSSTEEIWFYEHPMPPERSHLKTPSYSKNSPLKYEEFGPLLEWWNNREENANAWRVAASSVAQQNYNLDQKNPNRHRAISVSLTELGRAVESHAHNIDSTFRNLKTTLEELDRLENEKLQPTSTEYLGGLCDLYKGKSPTQKTSPGDYPFVVTAPQRKTADTYQFDTPAVCVPTVSSTGHGHASIHRIHYQEGKFALANIMAALVVKPEKALLPRYLYYYLWQYKEEKLVALMAGTANTTLTLTKLKTVSVSYPSLDVQETIVSRLDRLLGDIDNINEIMNSSANLMQSALSASLAYSFPESKDLPFT